MSNYIIPPMSANMSHEEWQECIRLIVELNEDLYRPKPIRRKGKMKSIKNIIYVNFK